MRGLVSAAVIVPVLLAGAATAATPDAPYADYLRSVQVTPDPDGIAAYLESLLPSEETRRRERQLVARLGSSDSRERDEAMTVLLASVAPPIHALEQAAESGDPEVRVRARHLLQRVSRSDQAPALHAALRVVEIRRMPGLTDVLLRLADQWPSPNFRRTLCRTLVATVGPDDAPVLREAADSDAPRRLIALPALAVVGGDGAADRLARLCEDSDEHVRLAAAQGLAFARDRRCLGALVDLLESSDLQIRCDAGDLLTRVTGERLGFAGYADRLPRAAAVLAWREWVARHGDHADLKVPADPDAAEIGRTLICIYAEKTLREFDATGEVTLNVGGFKYVWGCQGLPNGHRLAVDAEQRTLCEYDLAGQPCWKASLPVRATSVQRLHDGNTLVAGSDDNRIVELAPDGSVVWQLIIKGRPTTAQRLDNGLTLVNLQDIGRVVEVDRDGKVHWSLDGLTRPHTAQGLENGNVLVCDMRKEIVVEYDRSKLPVWQYDELENPAQAQRLANGNTLIADAQGLHEITVDGKRVWHYPVSRARFHRY